MELLQDTPPPGFAAVARVFAMARLLPTSRQVDLQVGLARGAVLVARGRLGGYRQVSFFSEHLRRLGWREHLLGGDEEMFGCDMLFSHPADAPEHDDDPSFIRRPAAQMWGLHADQPS